MTVYAFLADGVEEVEALAVVDLLRRAEIDTVIVSVQNNDMIEGSHKIGIRADAKLSDIFVDAEDVVFLPGGGLGTKNLKASEELAGLLQSHAAENGRFAAICAAPSVLGKLGLLEGKKATCYPGFEEELTGAEFAAVPVVTDGLYTTSRGMGTSTLLGLELIRILKSEEEAKAMAERIMLPASNEME